jgi:hypothetical protein
MRLKQCTTLKAKKDFSFKVGGKGRNINVREGQRFWVSTTFAAPQMLLAREKGGQAGTGYAFDEAQLAEFFEVVV